MRYTSLLGPVCKQKQRLLYSFSFGLAVRDGTLRPREDEGPRRRVPLRVLAVAHAVPVRPVLAPERQRPVHLDDRAPKLAHHRRVRVIRDRRHARGPVPARRRDPLEPSRAHSAATRADRRRDHDTSARTTRPPSVPAPPTSASAFASASVSQHRSTHVARRNTRLNSSGDTTTGLSYRLLRSRFRFVIVASGFASSLAASSRFGRARRRPAYIAPPRPRDPPGRRLW